MPEYLDETGLNALWAKIKANDIIHLEDAGTVSAGLWLAKNDLITEYKDGQVFLYKITLAGLAAGVQLNVNGLGFKYIYRYNNTKLTTHYAVGMHLLFTYNASKDGFVLINDYDANSYAYVRQYQNGNSTGLAAPYYCLLARYATGTTSTYKTEYTRYHTGTYINADTGALYAPSFYENGTALSEKYALRTKAGGSLSLSGSNLTLTSVSGTDLATVTLPSGGSSSTKTMRLYLEQSGGQNGDQRGYLKIYLHGFDSSDVGKQIWLYRKAPKYSGRNIAYTHPANYDGTINGQAAVGITVFGYASVVKSNPLSGTSMPSLIPSLTYSFMPHNGAMQTEWTLTSTDIGQGYLRIDLWTELLAVLMPYANVSTSRNATMSDPMLLMGRCQFLKFMLVDDGEIVNIADGTIKLTRNRQHSGTAGSQMTRENIGNAMRPRLK